jgi:hypothetical protein
MCRERGNVNHHPHKHEMQDERSADELVNTATRLAIDLKLFEQLASFKTLKSVRSLDAIVTLKVRVSTSQATLES